MRYLIYISLFIGSCLAHADTVDIKTIIQEGKTVFYLNTGAFSKSENAEHLKNELVNKFKEPVNIKQQEDKKLHIVQIGPINDYQTARKIKEQLSTPQVIAKVENIPTKIAENKAEPSKTVINNFENELAMILDHLVDHAPTETTAVKARDVPAKIILAQIENEPAKLVETKVINEPVVLSESKKPIESKKLWNIRNGDIRAVIAEVSNVTGKNFVIDPRVQGKISIVSNTPLSNKALYEVFLSVLQVSNYAAIPSGDVIKIIPSIDAKSIAPSGVQLMPVGDDMMVQVIPVHYVPAEQLVPVLRPLMPQFSNVSAYAPSNMLILSGRASNIKRLGKIISKVDSSSSSGVEIIPLKHSLAMDIASTLKELIKTQPNASSGHAQIMVAADDRSNSILLSGTKTDRIRIHMLISKLDTGSTNSQNANTKVIYLHYLRAEDLVPILAGVAQANFSGNVGTTIGTVTAPALDSTSPVSSLANSSNSSGSGGVAQFIPPSGGNGAAFGAPNTAKVGNMNEGSTKPTVQIIAEPNTNSVIINAPAALIAIIQSVIEQLDIKPAQLLIEAMVVQINESDVKDLGIEWGTTQALAGGRGAFQNGFAIIKSTTNINDFQAQIWALVNRNRANILSTPSVVVLDNRQAKILVGQQISIAAATIPNNTNAAGAPFTTYSRQNVALHLYVRPQITRGNGIQMQIDQGNDTLEGGNAAAIAANATGGVPVINISSIVTSIHMDSGDIVVLGGLSQDTLSNRDNGLPIVGDIPGLGRLFQRNQQSRGKLVTMVFIKPIILKNERDNFISTENKYNDIRQYQLDWLRSQEYNKRHVDVLMPNLQEAILPKPFSNPPQRLATK